MAQNPKTDATVPIPKAIEILRVAVAKNPQDYQSWETLAILYRHVEIRDHQMSAACYDRVLQSGEVSLETLCKAIGAFLEASQIEKCITILRNTLKTTTQKATIYGYLSMAYRANNQFDNALICAKKAQELAVKKPYLWADYQRGFCELSVGNYNDGFKFYDQRQLFGNMPEFKYPGKRWDGEDIAGKTVLVVPEQGFGDVILKSRFLPTLLDKKPAKLMYHVRDKLSRLYDNYADQVELVFERPTVANYDFWIPMDDVLKLLDFDYHSLPAPVNLSIPRAARARAQSLTKPYQNKFKIGVMWSGNARFPDNHKRACDHRQFLKFADIPNVQMFSLYQGPLMDAYEADGTSTIILNSAKSEKDFADSAAFMQSMDLIISTDSAVVHVAGSLGLPIWNLLHYETFWFYGPERGKTKWYPSMRLVHQKRPRDWDELFARIKPEIAKLAAAKTHNA